MCNGIKVSKDDSLSFDCQKICNVCFDMSMWFSERWFGKDWREVYMVLHEDSTLMWYSEREDSSPLGGIILKDSPEMIAVGQVRNN